MIKKLLFKYAIYTKTNGIIWIYITICTENCPFLTVKKGKNDRTNLLFQDRIIFVNKKRET